MALPKIHLTISNTLYGPPENGDLVYKYAPFTNLKTSPSASDTTDLVNLRISSNKAGINILNPLILDTETSYDDSVNLIVNDKSNPLKIVNSRFYLTSSTTYKIADRKGNIDTNVYTEDNFKIEAGLVKAVRSIVTLDFLGIYDGGKMPIGNYNFYFKLADADGNESDFISESGKVVCHIGATNQPKSIRGGQMNENSEKTIKFRLNNLDLAYDYINIYYTRTTGSGDSELTTTHKITDKFKISNVNTEITITGYENHEEISSDEINLQYANFDSAKTNTNCQNITFVGNILKDYDLYSILEKYSLLVTPQIVTDESIGNLNSTYTELYPDGGYEYYNVNNIYYKLGYWDEEIYRFGIVYILNDYTLCPVFNIRGIKTLNETSTFIDLHTYDQINWGDDYIIENSNNENSKGVFKIDTSTSQVFNDSGQIKPIGLKFNFTNDILIGSALKGTQGIKELTKGFFIVRQKRIPTILAQGVAIGTSTKSFTPVIKGTVTIDNNGTSAVENNWFIESFLHNVHIKNESNNDTGTYKRLGRGLNKITNINNNALLCPEACVRPNLFNSFFNSSEFKLKKFKYISKGFFSDVYNDRKLFNLGNLQKSSVSSSDIISSLLLVEPGIELINNSSTKFCSKAGNESTAYKHLDAVYGDIDNPLDMTNGDTDNSDTWTNSVTKLRGEFNTYIGSSYNSLDVGQYYNIFQKNYDFESSWKDYFRIRYNDSSAFMPVSDKIGWDVLTYVNPNQSYISNIYRGDCYINTYTHRINWNFIDPELPTNQRIVDPFTWQKNFKVKTSGTVISVDDGSGGIIKADYRKMLQAFTYKSVFVPEWKDDSDNINLEVASGLIEPDSKKFKKYSEANGEFGASKMNRPDINAVALGHWVTFKICSNENLAMRDLDFTLPEEEAIHKQKRGFFPFQDADPTNRLPESSIINLGISKTLGDKYYFAIPDVPFIKTSFSTRIYYSDVLQDSAFKNGNRIFRAQNYQDYTLEHGSLTKLIEWYGKLIAVMEHGVILIPVNERAMMTNESGENVYINTENVLPKNPAILSNTFGSIWHDSIIKTSRFVYGIDTVGKKIWRTNGQKFEIISDMKIQKFLNDNIHLKDSDTDSSVGINFIKSHYNAFKQDIIFTFKYGNYNWSLCWNELTNKWVTQYTWFPEFSENINNIFYTFANESKHLIAGNKLYKHGFAGNEEQLGEILPTRWYDEQHPFEYEFIVIGVQGIQKIFNNLKIISNLTEPESFYYEIVGEGFDWNKYKNSIVKIGNIEYTGYVDGTLMPIRNLGESDSDYLSRRYEVYLLNNSNIPKLPYINIQSFDINNLNSWFKDKSIVKDLTIREHNKTKEKLVDLYQKGLDIRSFGRLKGNMQYLEDAWDIQIQPISFKYAYIKDGSIAFTNLNEMKIRDKYIKIRVKYNGSEYAIINALKTFFTLSYA